jgi:hypothetical protein
MNDGGTGEINMTVTKTEISAKIRQPATAPNPAAATGYRVDDDAASGE